MLAEQLKSQDCTKSTVSTGMWSEVLVDRKVGRDAGVGTFAGCWAGLLGLLVRKALWAAACFEDSVRAQKPLIFIPPCPEERGVLTSRGRE